MCDKGLTAEEVGKLIGFALPIKISGIWWHCTIQHISPNAHLSQCSHCAQSQTNRNPILFLFFPPFFTLILTLIRSYSRSMSGEMPDIVQIAGKELKVLKVDDTVNTTFVCEVKNRIGTGRDQVTAMVRGELTQQAHVPNTCTKKYKGTTRAQTNSPRCKSECIWKPTVTCLEYNICHVCPKKCFFWADRIN